MKYGVNLEAGIAEYLGVGQGDDDICKYQDADNGYEADLGFRTPSHSIVSLSSGSSPP